MDRSTGESFFCWAFTGNYHNIISICVIGKGSPDITCILKVAAVFIRYRRVNEDDFAESICWIPTCMNLFFNGSNLLIYSFVNGRLKRTVVKKRIEIVTRNIFDSEIFSTILRLRKISLI